MAPVAVFEEGERGPEAGNAGRLEMLRKVRQSLSPRPSRGNAVLLTPWLWPQQSISNSDL